MNINSTTAKRKIKKNAMMILHVKYNLTTECPVYSEISRKEFNDHIEQFNQHPKVIKVWGNDTHVIIMYKGEM